MEKSKTEIGKTGLKIALNTAIIILFALTGCSKKQSYFPAEKEMERQTVTVVRFDSALLAVDTTQIGTEIRKLYAEYPYFMPTYVEDILGIATTDTAYLEQALPQFLADTAYGFSQTNRVEQAQFADISDLKNSMEQAFTRLHYLYPDLEIPTVYLFVSGFNASIYFVENDIAVGADMYLGSDYEYYNRVVYDYQKLTMRKECIPVDVVSAYLFRTLPYTSTKSRLLDQMIYRGKVMYLLSLLFPTLPEYEVMGYTKEQWRWCEKNEEAIWHLVMDKRDLFKTENLVLTSYLNDGPFTSEVSQEAPGRLGTWLGWRIAESYMQHNKEVTLQELMAEGDAQKIMEMSFYKP